MSYSDIALQGGGILDTVRKTRAVSPEDLISQTLPRLKRTKSLGITTCEIKSGYGLTIEDELKLLKTIQTLAKLQPVDLISTCLAAHTLPPEYTKRSDYLNDIVKDLFPALKKDKLTNRIDIFVDELAFSINESREYSTAAKKAGFSICLHADQFSRGGAMLAAELKALSADHLESSKEDDFKALKENHVIPIVLPGSSIGLGLPYSSARQMLAWDFPS